MRDILFSHPDGLRLTPIMFTKSTAKKNIPDSQKVPSTDAKNHLAYFDDNEWVRLYQEYSKVGKMRSTYVGKEEDPKRGGEPSGFWQYLQASTIHPSFNLSTTVTGRTSSRNPNGQNIPKRGKLAQAYRRVFVARPGYTLIECDLSQAELRIAAWMAHEENMLAIYEAGGDIHAATAAAVMGLTIEQFNRLDKDERDLQRFRAKAVKGAPRHSAAEGTRVYEPLYEVRYRAFERRALFLRFWDRVASRKFLGAYGPSLSILSKSSPLKSWSGHFLSAQRIKRSRDLK